MGNDELSRMRAGQWYRCLADELEALWAAARDAVREHNTIHPSKRGSVGPALRDLLAKIGDATFVEAPFHCAYGCNIHLADAVYLNAGCAWSGQQGSSRRGP